MALQQTKGDFMQYLSLYLDHAKVGCGWRGYLVLKVGRIHARVICAETAESFSIPKKDLAHGRPLPLKRTRALRRLRDVARTYGMEDSRGVKDALAMLRTAKSPATLSGAGL